MKFFVGPGLILRRMGLGFISRGKIRGEKISIKYLNPRSFNKRREISTYLVIVRGNSHSSNELIYFHGL